MNVSNDLSFKMKRNHLQVFKGKKYTGLKITLYTVFMKVHFFPSESCKHLKDVQVSLLISDFYQGKADTEDTKLKKWQKFVKDIKVNQSQSFNVILKIKMTV